MVLVAVLVAGGSAVTGAGPEGSGAWTATAGSRARDRALLRAARAAFAQNDRESGRRFLRGWAGLQTREMLPKDLAAEAAAAVAFIERAGPLRLYGWWHDGLVQIGVTDPAGIVDRVQAWVVDKAGRRTSLHRVSDLPGRSIRYRLEAGEGQRVVAHAVAVVDRSKAVVLTELTLDERPISLPPAPDPRALAARFQTKPPTSPGDRAERPPALRWWWVAAGVAAVALTGAAIAREF